jgi:MFS transporter, FSR family, fosmidomycin resistance protein
VLLAVELLDELVFGTREAAWPQVQHDLGLTYTQIGLILSAPGWVGLLVDPVVGVLADRGRRRLLMAAGGCMFAVATLGAGIAPGFAAMLAAAIVLFPASGALVGLSEATLMDLEPGRREHNMARWTLAGSVGVVVAPIALALGLGWRLQFVSLALLGALIVPLVVRLPIASEEPDGSLLDGLRATVGLVRRRTVVRWLVLLEVANLMLDVLHGFLALYLVDVAGMRPTEAALGIAIWTGAGLVGDGLLLLVLRRASGLRYLRWSAVAMLPAYSAFLFVDSITAKLCALAVVGLLHAGWYAIPQARLYDELGEQSGAAMALGTASGVAAGTFPLAIGLLAGAVGLANALLVPLIAPIVLVLWLPRERMRR